MKSHDPRRGAGGRRPRACPDACPDAWDAGIRFARQPDLVELDTVAAAIDHLDTVWRSVMASSIVELQEYVKEMQDARPDRRDVAAGSLRYTKQPVLDLSDQRRASIVAISIKRRRCARRSTPAGSVREPH